MIEDFCIIDDVSKIFVYVGMVMFVFILVEFVIGVMWGWLSDKIGWKLVFFIGFVGIVFSVFIFGFLFSLFVVFFVWVFGGLLNGNIGVL